MADVEDAKNLEERVWELARQGKLVELRVVLEEHPEVNVDGYKDRNGYNALYHACEGGHTDCAQLLIDHGASLHVKNNEGESALDGAAYKGFMSCVQLLVQNGADVNSQDDDGWTPLMNSMLYGHLTIAQYLLEQKANVQYRVHDSADSVYCAMRKHATDRTPGIAFAVLSCNTDAKNVKIDNNVTISMRDAHIEEYKSVQAYIDEHHSILKLVLSEHVPVDTRVGRGDTGIYHEPLERTLEYLGLSMSKDQVVNTSIDREAARRALIPGHLLNADHWFDKYKSR
jgi:hypothetical protein